MILVYGLKKSGLSIKKLLEKKNQSFKIWDDDKSLIKKLKKNIDKNLFLQKVNLNKFEKIFVSPGISIRQNKFTKLKKPNRIQRDLNLYLDNLTNQYVIAITGTNGKSTTTKLIGDMLKKRKISTFVGGNIGKPLCNAYIKRIKFNYHVIELSSFQLETVKNFHPNISIITNLSIDHLDRYKNINDYINQKKKIITNTGINLISIDDVYSKKIFLQKKINNKINFSILDKKADVYIGKNYILDNFFNKNKKIFIKNLSIDLEGHYNKQNIVISYICSKILKIPENIFLYSIKNFEGLPYRSNLVFENKKLKIINNSKSTNLNSTINSIKNYEKIYLIMGGIAKEENFKRSLSLYANKIKYVYLYGKSGLMIEKNLGKKFIIKRFANLKQVVKQIFLDLNLNKIQSTILFAPACSSYDQYINFEKRGEEFNNLIKKYLKSYAIS
tara:strand:+ start:2842 stop:4170 length:1329 start_codon:yes stop_codon:yes gene_type:complete